MQGYANWGGLVKKLGFLFVTQILLSDELAQPWCAATPIAALIRMGGIRFYHNCGTPCKQGVLDTPYSGICTIFAT